MIEKFRKYACALLLILAAGHTAAQTAVFTEDFESPASRAQWDRNKFYDPAYAVDLCNKWYIGQPGNCGEHGHYGLYISSDRDSARAVYSAPVESYTLAYREITGLQAGVNYTLQFSYRLQGGDNAYCQVWWLPSSYIYLDPDNKAPDFTDWQINGGFQIGSGLSGHAYWTTFQANFSLSAGVVPGRLVFLWYCRQSSIAPPSACIDDIRIYDGTPCGAPGNPKYDAKKGSFSWTGLLNAQYEVMFYNTFTGSFEGTDTIQGLNASYVMKDEGYYMAYVRRLCNDEVCSPWVSHSSFVWIKGKRCLDYLDIGTSNTNTGMCFVGKHENSTGGHANLSFTRGQMVNNGFQDPTSMHTIHYDRTEVDPNSNGGLKTVPSGEIASVRLGAYTSSGQDARIEYQYTVKGGESDLLLLKYACVLNSGGHDEDNPFFQLDILDQNGRQIEGCTHEYFVADMTGEGGKWHQVDGGTWWSDWDQVAVSLRDYRGQTLTIRLTSSRCVFDTHFGYAYFTIGCQSGELEGIACGDFSTDHFDAPDGFDYRWYWEGDPGRTLSTDRTFNIGKTTDSIFVVDVISKIASSTGDRCYYSLTANPNPRFPRALGTYTVDAVDCENVVHFIDTSAIFYINRKTKEEMVSDSERPDVWIDFGDGTEKEQVFETIDHAYPAEGGTYTVTLVAAMSNDVCTDTLTIAMNLPKLTTNGVHQMKYVCEGKTYTLPSGVVVTEDTLFVAERKNKYGCYYGDTLDVRFLPITHDTVRASICEGGYVEFEGQKYTEAGDYEKVLKNMGGCDSIRRLELNVVPAVQFETSDTTVLCDDVTTLEFVAHMKAGFYMGMSILADERAVAAGFKPRYDFPVEQTVEIVTPTDYIYEIVPEERVKPGYYTFRMEPLAERCPADSHDFILKMQYSSSVLYQKAGYIVLYNPQYNYAGYEFSSYRWYRNGVLLPDTKSYIQPTAADYKALYHVELTRSDDGSVMESCPFEYTGVYTPHAQEPAASPARIAPTCLAPGRPMSISGEGMVRVLTPLGNVVGTAEVHADEPIQLAAPRKHGVYFVVIGDESFRVLVQ